MAATKRRPPLRMGRNLKTLLFILVILAVIPATRSGARSEPMQSQKVPEIPLRQWIFEGGEGSPIELDFGATTEFPAARVAEVTVPTEPEAGFLYHNVQFFQGQVALKAEKKYVLSFWAKSDEPCAIQAGVFQNYGSDQPAGLNQMVAVTTEWTHHRCSFQVRKDDDNLRVCFGIGSRKGKYWFASVSLTEEGDVSGRQLIKEGSFTAPRGIEFLGDPQPQAAWFLEIRGAWQGDSALAPTCQANG